MAEEGTTAQVHPQKLTAAFMGAAQAAGAKLVRGSIQGIAIDKKSNSVTGEGCSRLRMKLICDIFSAVFHGLSLVSCL